MINIVNMLK